MCQDRALEWQRRKREVCAGCGTRRAEWASDPFAFVATMDACPGCELIEQAREQVPEQAQGVKLYLIPREVMEARIAAGEDVG